jgi:Xaa-Pro aminopeptidase
MILSNEPGFYEEGSFGIRIENLIVVETAPPLPGQTVSQMLRFETLTWVPIDLTLVIPSLMTQAERDWLNGYHAEVLERVGPLVNEADREWLKTACRAI